MHPARSVIFFTTASGAGYGLIVWLAILASLGALPTATGFALAAFALALALVTAGLLASTFHLAHPERAWRALSQWRSSWLSREGVAALATYLPAGLAALVALALGFGHWATLILVLAAGAGALATVVSTAMIYASLKAVPAWASALTPASYLAFAGLTGAVLAHALMRLWEAPGAAIAGGGAVALAFIAFAIKVAAWHRIDTAAPLSTPETATGLGAFGRVRLLEAPHSSPNYLMKEMGFEIARRHGARLRRIAVICAFFVPAGLGVIALALGGTAALAASLVTALTCLAGTAIERWLFFAEARHVVMAYYGRGEPPR